MSDILQPSKLGTKEHWDEVYSRELTSFDEIGDEGEVWFGADVLEKMRDWVVEHAPTASNPFILDVGTGNGNVLFELVDAGYNPARLCGIDYSEDAVSLAQSVAAARQSDAIAFKTLDFLNERPAALEGMTDDRWDLVIDKGTLDAIALAAPSDDNPIPSDKYPAQIAAILKPGGFFLITSCNFTESELRQKFESINYQLKYHSHIKYPSITFGGHTGSTYATVAFHKYE